MREETKETKKIQIVEEQFEDSDRKHYRTSRNQSQERTVEPSTLSVYPNPGNNEINPDFEEKKHNNLN